MRTEARKTYRHGFNLTEQELRRIMDTTAQQVQRIDPLQPPRVRLDVKFKNGTVARTSSLDDVLSFENIGSRQIIRLDIMIKGRARSGEYAIALSFTNLKLEDYDIRSITYLVRGEERDWVLVTSSELEERIGRIKCFSWGGPSSGRRSILGWSWLPILAALLSMGGLVHAVSQRTKIADVIEARWKAGSLRDPIEAIILTQRDYESRDAAMPGTFIRWALVYPLALGIMMILCSYFAAYLYPSYVFNWGDYVKTYDKRLALRKLVFVGIIGSLAISIIAGVIVNRTGWGR
jgi:hypothetical protein